MTDFDWTDNRDMVPATATDGDPAGNDVAGDPHTGGACTVCSSTCFDLTRALDQNLYLAQVGG